MMMIKNETEDFDLTSTINNIECELGGLNIKSEIKSEIKSDLAIDIQQVYKVANEQLVESILMVMHFYTGSRNLPNIATMDLLQLIRCYRIWDQLCQHYLSYHGIAVQSYGLMLDLRNMSVRKIREHIDENFRSINEFCTMMENDRNYRTTTTWDVASYRDVLRAEFNCRFRKMNYLRPGTSDAPVWQSILPLRNDVLDITVRTNKNDLYGKLFQ